MHGTADRRGSIIFPRIAAVLLFAFGLFPLANVLTDGEAVVWYRHALAFWILIGGTLMLVTFALARWRTAMLEGLWTTGTEWVLSIRPWIFVTALAAAAFVLSAAIAVYCFGAQPHNADEVAQLFHARILLSGRLSLPVDPNPEFFGMDNMIDKGRWYSQFPVGGPAFLAFGTALHAAWLLNPLLIGLTVISVYGMNRVACGEGFARAATILFALSPGVLFMSASFMNHVATLWLASVAMWQFMVWTGARDRAIRLRAALLIGLASGVAFTVRPLDALVVAAVIGAMMLSFVLADRSLLLSVAVACTAGLVPVCMLFYANYNTTGAPLRLGYEVLYGTAHQLGFHVDPYGTAHTPMRALLFASKYLLQLNVLLFEWPLPVVGVIVAGLLAIRRTTRWDVFMLGLLCCQVVAYALYWHDGVFRGPRFLFTAIPALVYFTVQAPQLLARRTQGVARLVVLYSLPMCMLFSWLAFGIGDSIPGRIRQYHRTQPVTRVRPDSIARANSLTRALVFVNEGREARNLHYLWALGLSRGDATRLMVSASACAIQLAINEETSMSPPRPPGRRDRLIHAALAHDSTHTESAACTSDERRDDAGVASFAPFFPVNPIDVTGHINGDIIYVLDLGEHNEVLRQRFGDRPWFRFGPRAHPADSLPLLIPYAVSEGR